jgi:hypothetical protein
MKKPLRFNAPCCDINDINGVYIELCAIAFEILLKYYDIYIDKIYEYNVIFV